MFGINKNLSIHFIGIGGIGMSGIAHVLISLGYKVSGSDISESATVLKLKAAGAKIYLGHHAENIEDVQLIVYSSAIDNKNPEIIKAVKTKTPIIKRAEMLAELMRLKYGIAVAGSHGKTTTTSLISTIFRHSGKNPTCIVGGIVKSLGGQAISGDSKFLIAEADESDGSFLYLNPIVSTITNIDNDHLDYYKNEEAIYAAFKDFGNRVPFYGSVCLNLDDPKSQRLLVDIKRPYVTYSTKKDADYRAKDIKLTDTGCEFTCYFLDQKRKVSLSLAGIYNVQNALAAISASHRAGISFEQCCDAVAAFDGVGRRFEYLKNDEELVVIDDYAHHPTEIKSILNTFVEKYKNYNKIVIFQPHRYSRTREFWNQFCDCFNTVDLAYITPIYAASETPIDYIDSEIMVKTINERGGQSSYLPDWEKAAEVIAGVKGRNTALLTLGAGSISREIRKILGTP